MVYSYHDIYKYNSEVEVEAEVDAETARGGWLERRVGEGKGKSEEGSGTVVSRNTVNIG